MCEEETYVDWLRVLPSEAKKNLSLLLYDITQISPLGEAFLLLGIKAQ